MGAAKEITPPHQRLSETEFANLMEVSISMAAGIMMARHGDQVCLGMYTELVSIDDAGVTMHITYSEDRLEDLLIGNELLDERWNGQSYSTATTGALYVARIARERHEAQERWRKVQEDNAAGVLRNDRHEWLRLNKLYGPEGPPEK